MKQGIAIVLLCITAAGCNSSSTNQRPSSKYEEKKASIADMERDSPLKFLKISGSHRNNLINQTVVEGEVFNKSTLTTYKNIKIKFVFLDKEGSSVEKEELTINDEIKPGSSSEFKMKIKHVKEAMSVTMDVVDAVADK